MPISILDQAIASHPFSPKGIKVDLELWKQLVASERIEWKHGYLEGIIDSGIDLPVINGKIFVHVDPDLGDFSFQLPKSP